MYTTRKCVACRSADSILGCLHSPYFLLWDPAWILVSLHIFLCHRTCASQNLSHTELLVTDLIRLEEPQTLSISLSHTWMAPIILDKSNYSQYYTCCLPAVLQFAFSFQLWVFQSGLSRIPFKYFRMVMEKRLFHHYAACFTVRLKSGYQCQSRLCLTLALCSVKFRDAKYSVHLWGVNIFLISWLEAICCCSSIHLIAMFIDVLKVGVSH